VWIHERAEVCFKSNCLEKGIAVLPFSFLPDTRRARTKPDVNTGNDTNKRQQIKGTCMKITCDRLFLILLGEQAKPGLIRRNPESHRFSLLLKLNRIVTLRERQKERESKVTTYNVWLPLWDPCFLIQYWDALAKDPIKAVPFGQFAFRMMVKERSLLLRRVKTRSISCKGNIKIIWMQSRRWVLC